MRDHRAGPAKFYDLAPNKPDDVPFYIERIPTSGARVLELGCGTGRVAIPLAAHVATVQGIDKSEAMLEIGRHNVASAGLESRVRLESGDISAFDLPGHFDYIIAPFRVIQNLETEPEFAGLLSCIKAHLSPSGRCILNVFNPNRDPATMRREWVSPDENLAWEVQTPDGRVACYARQARIDADRLVLFPELTYRRFQGEEVVEEAVLRIAMRCFYPEEFVGLIEAAGFEIFEKWGGYGGEVYGEGGELVVEFGVES